MLLLKKKKIYPRKGSRCFRYWTSRGLSIIDRHCYRARRDYRGRAWIKSAGKAISHWVSGRVENLLPSRSQDRKRSAGFATMRDIFSAVTLCNMRCVYICSQVPLSARRAVKEFIYWTTKYVKFDNLIICICTLKILYHVSVATKTTYEIFNIKIELLYALIFL